MNATAKSLLLISVLAGCGARTGLRGEDLEIDANFLDGGTDGGPIDPPDARVDAGLDASLDASVDAGLDASDASDGARPECAVNADCTFRATFCTPYACMEGTCIVQPTPACDDSNICTSDRCDSVASACVHTARTTDADGDGFKGPLAGKNAGDPGACGDDCNDGDARVNPRATELCNGVDDNCAGGIDEGAIYQTVGSDQRLSPASATIAAVSHLASYRDGFALGYSASVGSTRFSPFMGRLTTSFVRTGTDLDLTALAPADGDGARVAWAGDRFGITWSDRRAGNYEVYFALADALGRKLAPGDLRITSTQGFSIMPSIVWTGVDFLVVWQDERRSGYDVQAVRVAPDGSSVGPVVSLVSGLDSRNVSVVALPAGGFVFAWLEGTSIGPVITARVNIMRLNEQLVPLTGPVSPFPTTVSGGPALTIVDGQIAAAAHATSGVSTIVVLDAATLRTTATLALTNGIVSYGRDVALLGVGRRLAVAWADDRNDARTFEIYLQTFDAALRPAGAAIRVTNAAGDSVFPVLAAFGTTDAVLAWNDGRDGLAQVYGRALQCRTP